MKFGKHKAAYDTDKDLTQKEHLKRCEVHFSKLGVGLGLFGGFLLVFFGGEGGVRIFF